MTTDQYIGKFKEISSLSLEVQSDILENSRYEAFTNLGQSGKAALYMCACLLFGFLPCALLVIFTSLHFVVVSVILAFSIGGAFFLHNYLYKGLLHLGLVSDLKQRNV